MITKMNKVTLLIYYKEYEEFLTRLRNVGVVYIKERNSGEVETPEAQEMIALSGRYSRAIKRLGGYCKGAVPSVQGAQDASSVLEK